MSRIRTVKPELFRHEKLFDAELESGLPLRLAFIGLFTVADCEGRFLWKPRTVKLDVLPHDLIDFAHVLNALERHGFIQSYEVDGMKYGWIQSFTKHQRLQGKEIEAGSRLPAKPREILESNGEASGYFPESTQVHTGKHPEAQEEEEEEEEEGEEEGEGEEEKSASAQAPTARARKAKFPLPIDWLPDASTYAMLAKQGIDRPFAESCIDEFRLYWQENGEHRPGWEATFLNSVKRSWERQLSSKPRNKTPHDKKGNLKTVLNEWLSADPEHNAIEGTCTHEIH